MDKISKNTLLINLTEVLSSIWCHIPLNDCDIWTYHQHACLSIQLLFMGDICIWMWGKICESIFVYDTSKFGKDISIVKILEHLVPISITLVKLKWEGKSRAIMKTPRYQKQIRVFFFKCVKSHSQYSPLWCSKWSENKYNVHIGKCLWSESQKELKSSHIVEVRSQ